MTWPAALSAVGSQLAGLGELMMDFCYPGRCAICETHCPGKMRLCEACEESLSQIESEPACILCGAPLATEGAPCPFCQNKGVPHYDKTIRMGVLRDSMRDLIHHIKYRGQWALAEVLARRAYQMPRIKAVVDETDVIVAVPLHWARHIKRGFNQADIFAKQLARCGKKKFARPAVRIRNTETQTHHTREERLKNLRRAFALVKPEAIYGKRVLVVDDVRTTGATLGALARALRQAKPESLNALVIAIADPKGRDFQAV